MNYCYWWMEQGPADGTKSLLVSVGNLHRSTSRQHGFGNPTVWRRFVDELYDILQRADNVSDTEKGIIWQDSYGIRAVQCACRYPYVPLPVALGKFPSWWVHSA